MVVFDLNYVTPMGEIEAYCDVDQVINKANEVGQDAGRGSHGRVNVVGKGEFDHWRAGDWRIFGTWNTGTQRLDFYGFGSHTGRGSSNYKVIWCDGTTPRATTE